MKILHIFRDVYQHGGVPYEVRSLINGEIKNGHKIGIITSKRKKKVNNELNLDSNVIILSYNIIKDFGLLKNFIYNFNPDYMHFYSGWIPFNFYVWCIIRSIKRIPYIFSLHGILTPSIYAKRFGGKKNYPGFTFIKKCYHYIIDKYMLKNSIAIHCLSEYEAELSIKKLNQVKQIILPNGVEKIHDKHNSTNNIKLTKFKKLLFLGRLDIFQKGLDLLIDAILILNKNGYENEYSIDFIGPSINSSDIIIKNKITKNNLRNVCIKNSVTKEKLNSTIAEYDYLILPSRFEGLARVAREAVLNNVPVIASYESNFGDYVSKYKMGFCISNLNAQGIADAIIKAINVDELTYTEMVQNTFKWVNDYSWDNVAKRLNSEMSKLLNV